MVHHVNIIVGYFVNAVLPGSEDSDSLFVFFFFFKDKVAKGPRRRRKSLDRYHYEDTFQALFRNTCPKTRHVRTSQHVSPMMPRDTHVLPLTERREEIGKERSPFILFPPFCVFVIEGLEREEEEIRDGISNRNRWECRWKWEIPCGRCRGRAAPQKDT